MSLPSRGITANVIREVMPLYHLSPDLLEATFVALPPPPPDAPAAWRQARIARLMQEISTLMPAPFFGTVLADEVDVAVADAGWGGGCAGRPCAVPPSTQPSRRFLRVDPSPRPWSALRPTPSTGGAEHRGRKPRPRSYEP
jgi:hypothetical protein